MLKLLVDAMLKHGWSAQEIHDEIERAVNWIEDHPSATNYEESVL
jgi:hypothetical protein